MQTFTSGEDLQVAVPFERGGEPFLPDENSVSWTLRGQDGLPTTGYINVPIDATDTYVLVPVPAAANAVDPALRFEKRTLILRGETSGVPFEARLTYRITPWLNFTTSADDVRAFLGAAGTELADNELDLASAYFQLVDRVTASVVTSALASGLAAEQRANTAILALAALAALPGLRLKVMKRESDGNRTFERFALDFDALTIAAQALLAGALADLAGVDDTASPPLIWMLTSPTDPVTGA